MSTVEQGLSRQESRERARRFQESGIKIIASHLEADSESFVRSIQLAYLYSRKENDILDKLLED